ncbi:MAG: hypothetical protein MUC36_22940 [Planctomycetes bacterium]|nr:hypothetical protein [Planctomycetota bacterium]
MPPFVPPSGYHRIRVVASFAELVATPLADGVNAVCWARELPGDFDAIARHFAPDQDRRTIDDDELQELATEPALQLAIETLLADQRHLRELGHRPQLDCLRDYPRDADAVLPTDVYSFHQDSATVPTETFLCSYTGAASEGLRNDEAIPQVELPPVRARLLTEFGGDDDADFAAWLREHHYDLHHAMRPGAQPFSFGLGNLWRLAVRYPGCPVPACIHRAPDTAPLRPPRLLLIS